MPFCRECGKEVQEDWVTCPYCSESIGPAATKISSIHDSVVSGDVITNINDSKSISSAVQHAVKCVVCGSIGTTQTSCSECGKIAYCSVCEKEKKSSRSELVKPKLSSNQLSFYNGELWGEELEWEGMEPDEIDPILKVSIKNNRFCDDCFGNKLSIGYHECKYCKGYRKKETIVSCYRCDEQFCEVCASVLTDANIKSDIKFQGLDLPDSEIHLCRVVTKLIVDEDIFWSDHMRILGLKELHYRLDFKKKVETGSKGSCVTWDDNLWEKFYSKLLTKDGWDENLVDTLFIRLIKEEELVKQLLDEEQ